MNSTVKHFLTALLPVFGLCAMPASGQSDYPALQPYDGETAKWGQHIQRTMELLESSNAENRNTVRILFYGQSIMGGRWHQHVEKWLREKYPHANLVIENRALGGFAAQLLVRPMKHDVYPFYPDLVVFHVYGDHQRYEEIIYNIRKHTTAEVMILTDHWKARDLQEDGSLAFADWGRFYDEQVLPQVAKRYNCELVDVRWPWKAYLEKNDLKPADLLKDNVHLNDHGLWLMAQICFRQMVYKPELMTDVSKSLVKDYRIGDDVKFEDGKLELEFEGNRVDLVNTAAGVGAISVRLDGKAPSEYPEFYSFTRPTGLTPPDSWPAIYRVESEALPQEETWLAEITEITDDHETIHFRLTGSRTGFDGEGVNTERFVSNSGRVVIEPDDWGVKRSFSLKKIPAKAGMKIAWKCQPQHLDVYTPPTNLSVPGRETATTLFQGGARKTATLQLQANGENSNTLKAIRVHCPPIPAGEFQHLGLSPNGQNEANNAEILKPDLDK